jgi:hypothetical protein
MKQNIYVMLGSKDMESLESLNMAIERTVSNCRKSYRRLKDMPDITIDCNKETVCFVVKDTSTRRTKLRVIFTNHAITLE